MKFTRPLLDYRGLKLCDPCWNNHHWHKEIISGKDGSKKKGNRIIQDCLGPPCECPCIQLRKERHPKVKVDHSLNMDIDMTNPLQIGSIKSHKDE